MGAFHKTIESTVPRISSTQADMESTCLVLFLFTIAHTAQALIVPLSGKSDRGVSADVADCGSNHILCTSQDGGDYCCDNSNTCCGEFGPNCCPIENGICCEDGSCCMEDFTCLPPPGGCGWRKHNNTHYEGLQLPGIPLVHSSFAPLSHN